MGSEFDESEMYPCDICGEFWPMDDMYELEDGRVVCPGRTLLALAHRLLPGVEAYRSIEHPKEIKPQFEYNQYIRDFFADNKGATLKDAIRCWHWKKIQPGTHRYETTDKDILR
ncbi:MAG: hypothetical protein ACI4UJ_00950 [Candidatus Cryptobacteroides sp.]